MPFRNVL